MYNYIDLTQTVISALRNNGYDIPELSCEADACEYFGEELTVGKRYICGQSGKIKVYDGSQWLIQVI